MPNVNLTYSQPELARLIEQDARDRGYTPTGRPLFTYTPGDRPWESAQVTASVPATDDPSQ